SLKTKKICGAQNAPHIGLSFIQICLRQHNLTKSLKKHFMMSAYSPSDIRLRSSAELDSEKYLPTS
ncbi:hypothetical protein, partial [Enterococcus faecium]|uniref:hypothetical protein n=1 Tax=Enterococcus faecium TaxID=1352 RepID=UPI001E3EF1F7